MIIVETSDNAIIFEKLVFKHFNVSPSEIKKMGYDILIRRPNSNSFKPCVVSRSSILEHCNFSIIFSTWLKDIESKQKKKKNNRHRMS